MPEFSFEEGDTVLVRVREHGDSGDLRAKFVGEVANIDAFTPSLRRAKIITPWGSHARLKPTDAEFEVVDSADEVSF